MILLNSVNTIKKAMTYIDANLSETLTCNLIAKKFHYSEYHFHRLFQYVTNMSVTDYIRHKRLHTVANELLNTHKTVLHICLAHGFNNQRTFQRAFKAKYSMTPTEFKLLNIPRIDESPDCIIKKFYDRSAKESWTAALKVLPIALQVFSVRQEMEYDFEGTMRQVKCMGYDNVELCYQHDISAGTIRKTLDALNLHAVSTHVPYEDLNANTAGIINTFREIGCKYIVIPNLAKQHQPGGAEYSKALDDIYKIGSTCADNGITLLYHNHDEEFNIMPDGRYGLDHLYANTSSKLLQAQLDTGWIKYAGFNPADFIERYKMRVPVIHLKDFRTQDNAIEFMPIGHGVQDIPSILTAAVACGVELIVVEQDYSLVQTPLEAVEKSRNYLHKLGW